jgi:hypothetical protein
MRISMIQDGVNVSLRASKGYFATGDIGPFLSATGDRNTILTGDMDLSHN